MIPANFFWGGAFIVLGSSMILNKLYGICVPFELTMGAFLVFLGVSMLFNIKR